MATTLTAVAPRATGLGDLLGVAAHDLRAPLASVIGYLGLVLEEETDNLTAEQHRYLGIVRRDAERALRIANDLLTTDAVENGVPLNLVTVDLAAVARESAESFQPRAAAAGVALGVEVEAHALVLGDRQRLAQLVDNLIGNACAHTPAGGEVVVSVGRGAEGGWLAVWDTGSGVPEELRATLFDRYVRGAAPTGGHAGGAGLGLSIVRGIAEAHGGRVWLESAAGIGTVFVVEGLRPAATAGTETVLLVEDSVLMRRAAERVLRAAGLTVVAAATPGEALEFAALYDGTIDVVVSDFVMPEMDGIQLLRRLRTSRPGIHAVVCSSAMPGTELLASVGARFVEKPYAPEELAGAVTRAAA